jgi:hypothetical protein
VENLDAVGGAPDGKHRLENLEPDGAGGGGAHLEVGVSRLLHEHAELGAAGVVVHRADVAAALVEEAHAPVDARDLVADRVDEVLRVEVGQLVRQQLAHVQENQAAHAQQVALVRVVHHRRHLSVFVSVHVNSAENGQRRQLRLFFALWYVRRAVHRLVFEKHAIVLHTKIHNL